MNARANIIAGASPRLAQAVGELAANGLHQPDTPLFDLRAALLGTGFTWSTDGQLTLAPERIALLDEFDALTGNT